MTAVFTRHLPLRASPRPSIVGLFREVGPGVEPADRLVIEPGDARDAARLARFPYRAGPPATCALALRARDGRETVGALVVSMPTLNGAWRNIAWPGRYRSGDKRRDARRLNDEVRSISRVIVDPRWRAVGVGTRLVRAYLRDPITERTEAVAAMAGHCPIFIAAGMRECRTPPTRADERLLRALAAAGLEPGDLVSGRWADRVENALRTWARWSRATRRFAQDPLPQLARLAAARLLSPRIAYVSG